jgi:hypothetical protein
MPGSSYVTYPSGVVNVLVLCLIESKQRKFLSTGNNVEFMGFTIFLPTFLRTDDCQKGFKIICIEPHGKARKCEA